MVEWNTERNDSYQYDRKNIYEYLKSGKIFFLGTPSKYRGCIVIDLSPNYKIIKTRSLKTRPRADVKMTSFVVDFLRKETPTDEDDMISFSFRILRVINEDDLQLENWNPKKNIKVLPILKDKHITNEEEHWAGKVKGNEVEQVLSSILIIFLSYVIFNNANTGLIYFSPLILLWGYQIYDHGWIRTKKPDLNKLQQLTYYKETLLQEDIDLHKENLSQLDKNLMEFDFWKNIKPNEFELALARKLNNDGMRVKTTEFIGDGGIDIEGVDENGTPIIVQAKQYAGNIGVSVVREMIGVREEHPKNPRVVIYSLMGFSTGAKELAKTHNIELMSVRDDLLK